MMIVCRVILLRSSESGWVGYSFFLLYRCEQIQMNDESINQIRSD